MAGQKDKTVRMDEFKKNSGTGQTEANQILNRNGWKVPENYKETGRSNIPSTQMSHNLLTNDGRGFKNFSHPRSTGIDVGLGTAVNLDTRIMGNMTHPDFNATTSFSRQPGSSVLPSQFDQGPSSLPLTVKMPTSSSASIRGGRIIPIQIEGERSAASYRPILLRNDVTPSSDRFTPVSYSSTQPHSQVLSNEMVHPSQSRSSVIDKDVEAEYLQEIDDVFDDKLIQKAPSFGTYPRLKRGFSNIVENQGLVSEARHNVKSDIQRDSHNNMYIQTLVLPDLTAYDEDFRAFLEKELIETSTLVSLEQCGRLNWWAELKLCQRLLPMATSGDGNCLLHAASLAMWGIHDRQLILRKELHETLTKAPYKDALYRRWRYQQTMTNKQSGLVFSEAEWQDEWMNILHLASPLPRAAPDQGRTDDGTDTLITQGCHDPVVYESLEEFHVFVLAHVLQRPIIVVADTILKDSSGDALAPIPFPGVYLPLEVQTCFRSPLLLTYDAAHFSALVLMEQSLHSPQHLSAAIPLVDPELKLLPLHFHIDPGPNVNWSKGYEVELTLDDKISLLQKFLELVKLPLKMTDINGDSDKGSCGSQDSDETGTLAREKEKKKKEVRVAQQVQTVAKQFGSIGKSMGKRLKQLGKVGKGDKSRPAAGQEVTPSNKAHTNSGAGQGSGNDHVLVAKLSEKSGKKQHELIQNYLQDARQRFESNQELKKRSDVDSRRKVAPFPGVNASKVCITPGCGLFGTAQTNYLCSKCFGAQQREPFLANKAGGNFVYNSFPRMDNQSGSCPIAPDEMYTYGKSMFSNSSNENIVDKLSNNLFGNVNSLRGRDPSPDYDNCIPAGGETVHSSSNNIQRQYLLEDRQQCKNTGCDFYGSPEADGLCSKCYQRKYEASLSIAMQGITKL